MRSIEHSGRKWSAGIILLALLAATVPGSALAANFGHGARLTSMPLGSSSVSHAWNISRAFTRLSRGFHNRTFARPRVVNGLATDPAKLAIPASQLPAGAQIQTSQTVTAAGFDTANDNVFAQFHTQNYQLGQMQSGYDENGAFPIDSANDAMVFFYLGSIYPTADAATARVADAVKNLQGKDAACLASIPQCRFIAFKATVSGAEWTFIYTIMPVQNTVIELLVGSPSSVFNANQQSYVNGWGAVLTAAVQAAATAAGIATTTPTPTGQGTVKIKGLELAHTVKGKLVAIKSLKSGQKGIFLVEVVTQNSSADPSVSIAFTRSGKTLASGALDKLDSQGNDYVFGVTAKFKETKTVTITENVTATLDSSQDQAKAKFKVTKKK